MVNAKAIDPVPDGLKAPPSLIPLIHDLSFPPTGPGPDLWEGPIDILPADKWNIARLQIGSQAGVSSVLAPILREAD